MNSSKVLHIEINCSNTSNIWVVALMENWERKNVLSLKQAICIWTKITNIFWEAYGKRCLNFACRLIFQLRKGKLHQKWCPVFMKMRWRKRQYVVDIHLGLLFLCSTRLSRGLGTCMENILVCDSLALNFCMTSPLLCLLCCKRYWTSEDFSPHSPKFTCQ